MNRNERRIAAGLLAAAFAVAPLTYAAAADAKHGTGPAREKPPATDAPVIARVVVTPSPEQIAKIRGKEGMTGQQSRAVVAQRAHSRNSAATDAL